MWVGWVGRLVKGVVEGEEGERSFQLVVLEMDAKQPQIGRLMACSPGSKYSSEGQGQPARGSLPGDS